MTDTPTVGDLYCHACGTAASPCHCPRRRNTKTPQQLTDEIVRLQERVHIDGHHIEIVSEEESA